ncbi:alpha/beta fold hydrolase [Salinibacter sp.]|uniref:alpha/beta fold hydrolase n=1 Tax=Salinibacter sp. TaxID=2065818 RepID=UPI0021E97E2F|nr:alpha/beta fold hydrolase [Salinibacter sp.]
MPSAPTAPDATRTVQTPAGPLAYTDVGSGPPVVFLHGNPTSARLYRHLLRDLARDHRCIAPDYLGFGRSAAPADFSYRPPAHAVLVERLLRSLDLSNLTLVLHDWGGPIGLAYALRHPDTVRRLVLMNTWAWPLTHRPVLRAVSRLLATPTGRLAVEHGNAFARIVMPMTAGAGRQSDWIATYAAALDSRPRRHACWAFARALWAEADWLRALWTRRHWLRDCPALLCWGMADPAFGTEACLRRWQNVVSGATVRRYPSVGHYVPEELGPALVDPVRRFLAP